MQHHDYRVVCEACSMVLIIESLTDDFMQLQQYQFRCLEKRAGFAVSFLELGSANLDVLGMRLSEVATRVRRSGHEWTVYKNGTRIDCDVGEPLAWEQGAEAHAAGKKLNDLAENGLLQEAAPPRVPAGTSTLRWAESWAKEQLATRRKSVWRQMNEMTSGQGYTC